MAKYVFKPGMRFGRIEILLIQDGVFNMLCDCSNAFTVMARTMHRNGSPLQCKECNTNDRSGELQRGQHNPTAIPRNLARAYTDKEKQMIEAFEISDEAHYPRR